MTPRRRFRLLTVAAGAVAALVAVKAFDLGHHLSLGTGPLDIGDVAAEEATQPEAQPASPDSEAASVELGDLTPGDLALLQQLAQRRAELDRREQDLATREQALEVVERRIEDKVAELKELQATLEATIAERDAAEEEQLRSLVKIYENMKPKDAAAILDQLDTAILLDVIDRMKEAKAAPILALMDPEHARTVTQDLAHRRELPSVNN